MTTNTGGPAFPTDNYAAIVPLSTGYSEGMTLRQYAAIKLKVPDSGTDWLDEMIVKANRDYFAAKAMQGMLAYAHLKPLSGQSMYAIDAYKMADAMLAAREQK